MAKRKKLSKEELNRRRRERRAELRHLKQKRSEASKRGWVTRREKKTWKELQRRKGRPLTDSALNELWNQIKRFRKKKRNKVRKIIEKRNIEGNPIKGVELDYLLAELESYNLEEIEYDYWKAFRGDYARRKN